MSKLRNSLITACLCLCLSACRDIASFDVTDGQTRKARTGAHSTYRPLSNPLTASDAGASATISVSAFYMRVSGEPADIPLNSGSIAGLSYDTLYYVFYDDPTFAGGAVTYQASATKEDAFASSSRFFVGSIHTPIAGGPTERGNDDGGKGAQGGQTYRQLPIVFNVIGSAGTWNNQNNAFDGDPATYADVTVTANGTTGPALLSGSCFPNTLIGANHKMTLFIESEVVSNTLNGTGTPTNRVNVEYYLGGTSISNPVSIAGVGPGVTRARTIDSADITGIYRRNGPYGLSAGVSVSRMGADTAGSITVRLYRVWLEVQN